MGMFKPELIGGDVYICWCLIGLELPPESLVVCRLKAIHLLVLPLYLELQCRLAVGSIATFLRHRSKLIL